MVHCRITERIFLRPKVILLKSRVRGNADILIRNVAEFSTFLDLGKFQKSHLAALVHGVFCPANHLNAIYSNVARAIMRHIIATSGNIDNWADKILRNHFTLLTNLAKLYFQSQKLSLPRFNLLVQHLKDLKIFLIAFSNASIAFSSACVYIVTLDTIQDLYKLQLITTKAQIQTLQKVLR